MAISLRRIKSAARAELRLHKKLFAVIQFLLAVAALVYGLDMSKYTIWYDDTVSEIAGYNISDIGLVLFSAVICCGFIAVIVIFKDLNNAQTADVQLSLPLSSGERYASKLLTLAVMHIIPTVFYLIVGWLITYASNGFVSAVTVQNQKFFMLILSLSLFADAAGLFCTCCCGTFAESIYVSLITFGCVSVIPWAFFEQVVSKFSGVGAVDSSRFFGWWTFSSALFYSELYNSGVGYDSMFIRESIVSCVLSLALFAVTYLIYRKRDARTVGKPIVYKLFFEIFLFLGLSTVFIVTLFSSNYTGIGLLVAFVIYVVIRIVVSRAKVKPKDVIGWAAKYAVSLALFIAIAAVSYLTDGFGYINFLPGYVDGDTLLNIHIGTSDESNLIEFTDSDGTEISKGYVAWLSDESASKMTYSEFCKMIKDVRSEYKTEKSVSDFFDKLFFGDYYDNAAYVMISEYGANRGWYYDYSLPDFTVSSDAANAIAQMLTDRGMSIAEYYD